MFNRKVSGLNDGARKGVRLDETRVMASCIWKGLSSPTGILRRPMIILTYMVLFNHPSGAFHATKPNLTRKNPIT